MYSSFDDIIKEERAKAYYIALMEFLKNEEESGKTIFPPFCDVFKCFELTPLNSVKVVILGQDPYHGLNQAHGLCFSVKEGTKKPPSLINIFKEIESDIGAKCNASGDLTQLARQGVLLLNTVLTVEQGRADSHKNKGWEQFSDRIIACLNEQDKPIVFMLWGNSAKKKAALLNNSRHLVLSAAHPSPLSYRLFRGCKHFSKANEFLKLNQLAPIDWICNNSD